MQLSNTFASIANYTTSSLNSLGRFGVSTIQSGASLTCKTVRCASRLFLNSASFALNGIARHPKISVALGVLGGAAAVAVVAKKRFNMCLLEKLSGYCPFTRKQGGKVEEAPVTAEVDKIEKEDETAEASSLGEDVPTEVEDSPRSSRSTSSTLSDVSAKA
jgi:hypothetical protein